ncbi:MAG: DUF2933 domain-containing protein [Hyphomonadaceae bacterium]
MTSHHDAHSGRAPQSRRGDVPQWIVRILMIALVAVGAYYIIAEHGAHVLAAWPLLILLACPLMHVFMHGGHGGHGSRSDGERR